MEDTAAVPATIAITDIATGTVLAPRPIATTKMIVAVVTNAAVVIVHASASAPGRAAAMERNAAQDTIALTGTVTSNPLIPRCRTCIHSWKKMFSSSTCVMYGALESDPDSLHRSRH